MEAGFARILSDGGAELSDLMDAAEGWLAAEGVPSGAVAQIMVALDEVVSNALRHGSEGSSPAIAVAMNVGSGRVTVEVADDGAPFDPLAVAAPDIGLPVESRPIGGLGIHLVRQLADAVEYRRENGCNRLRFHKAFDLA